MSEFWNYCEEGFRHLTDPSGPDHLYFIASLCLPFSARQWRSLLWLVTAFTVGHSLTLALAALDVVRPNLELVETGILVTILLSGLLNFVILTRKGAPRVGWGQYLLVAGFGLIHGLGFSTYLKALLFAEDSPVLPLLGFNAGLELAQLCVVIPSVGLVSFFPLQTTWGRWLRLVANSLVFALVVWLMVG